MAAEMYAILMKHHGKELAVYLSEFDAELQRMACEDEAATAELTQMKDDLTMLRKIKGYVLMKGTIVDSTLIAAPSSTSPCFS